MNYTTFLNKTPAHGTLNSQKAEIDIHTTIMVKENQEERGVADALQVDCGGALWDGCLGCGEHFEGCYSSVDGQIA